jgi:hypothetical protein
MFTGDDYHYVGLIEGDGVDHSDALLGAFAALAPQASIAIQALDAGYVERYRTILGPTERLSQLVFAAPTFRYKTGIAFLAWLNGTPGMSRWRSSTRRSGSPTPRRWRRAR